MHAMEQTTLALNIASSILQFRPTVWYKVPWNSNSIKFPTRIVQGSHLSVCAPYVEQDVDAKLLQNHTYPSDLNTAEAKTTMLELAILLLEVMHHKSIDVWAARDQEGTPQTYQDRMRVATHWLEQSTGKLLPDHLQAIEECLVLCARSKISWDDKFQRGYCENIIKPLQKLVS